MGAERALAAAARLAVLAAGLLAAGCVVLPRTVDSFDPDCRVVTHHMELQVVEISRLQGCQSANCQAALVIAAGLVAASTLVSGSIVVVGNVVYWGEHRAGCAGTAMPVG